MAAAFLFSGRNGVKGRIRDMEKKEMKAGGKQIPGEAAYLLGIPLLALGVLFMVKADFGVSMVVAPAYLVHLRFPLLTFGMAEYLIQALLLLSLAVIRRGFSKAWLFSFITALYYAIVLDGLSFLILPEPAGLPGLRILFFLLGIFIASLGIALLFRTDIPLLVYELFVKEMAGILGLAVHRFKFLYDMSSLTLAAILTFLFFGEIRGIGWGTLVAALGNGWIIGGVGAFLDRRYRILPSKLLPEFFREKP